MLYLSKQGIYTSSAGVWVDRPIYVQADPGTNIYQTPASVQAAIFDELLRTYQFSLQIVHKAGVPTPNLIAEGNAVDDIQKKLMVEAVGAHLIKVSYTASKPTYVKSVVSAAVDLFNEQSTSEGLAQAEQTKKLYEQQLVTATQDMNASQDALDSYVQAHPDVLRTNSNDPTYNSLQQQLITDRQRVDDTQKQVDDLNFRIISKQQLGDITFNVMDTPSDSEPYKFTMKDLLRNEAIALVLALVVVTGLTVVFTWTDQSIYTLNDISTLPLNDQPGASSDLLVGVVPYVKSLAASKRSIVKYEGKAKKSRRWGRKEPRVTVVSDPPTARPSAADGVVRPIEALPDGNVARATAARGRG